MQEGRHLATTGDRVYARGTVGSQREWRIFRDARPLKDRDPGRAGLRSPQSWAWPSCKAQGKLPRAKTAWRRPLAARAELARREAGMLATAWRHFEPQRLSAYAPHAPAKVHPRQHHCPYEVAAGTGGMSVVSINRGRCRRHGSRSCARRLARRPGDRRCHLRQSVARRSSCLTSAPAC